MKYILQCEKDRITDIDVMNVKDIIGSCSYSIQYDLLDLEGMKTSNKVTSEHIPIGDLRFVKAWLNRFHCITTMKPIEVPEVLRKERYLGREYSILPYDEIIQKNLKGNWFIKDADELKKFSFLSSWYVLKAALEESEEYKGRNYVLSEFVDIATEYRVFVSDFDIRAIQRYDGDCTVFPDISMLKEMVAVYSSQRLRPKSYTMDIAVLKNGRTVIIEVHPVTSVGTYGYAERKLLDMYKDGIDFYLKMQ